jgi:hypothetical protein
MGVIFALGLGHPLSFVYKFLPQRYDFRLDSKRTMPVLGIVLGWIHVFKHPPCFTDQILRPSNKWPGARTMITPPTFIESAFGMRESELDSTPDLDPAVWLQAVQRMLNGLHENKIIYSERWYCLAQLSDFKFKASRVTFTVTPLWWPREPRRETWRGSLDQHFTQFWAHSWQAIYTPLMVWPDPGRVKLFEKYAQANDWQAAQKLAGSGGDSI